MRMIYNEEEKADHNKHIKWQREQIKRSYVNGVTSDP